MIVSKNIEFVSFFGSVNSTNCPNIKNNHFFTLRDVFFRIINSTRCFVYRSRWYILGDLIFHLRHVISIIHSEYSFTDQQMKVLFQTFRSSTPPILKTRNASEVVNCRQISILSHIIYKHFKSLVSQIFQPSVSLIIFEE